MQHFHICNDTCGCDAQQGTRTEFSVGTQFIFTELAGQITGSIRIPVYAV